MRRIAAVVFLVLGLQAAASAQRSHAYWYFAPGGATGQGLTDFTIHMAGGGELAIGRGFSAGLEAGALADPRHFSDSVLGVASVNGYFHFRPSARVRMDPFVTGGYSLFFRRGTANLGNFGGGLNYWFRPGAALRIEVRDHVSRSPRLHFWGVRLGLSFRELWP